ncbi:hypothetical protein SAMN05421803_101815 [Nocardiopsis flavescens]|uniref:Uncharacterized protein n=1 Tax=Nocardiopsis flavescens TaxID=758803 RepID=A0A1M6CTR3_9ACTN|nr:hypothetical protein [Nocardiopsis flavescens]SHI64417.1 hypothetical protein SAMN05421803_101815 [Nocardiopsis flavescens]
MPEPATDLFADPGSVLSFRTVPLYPVSPENTGRYAAAVVIGRTARVVVLVPLAEVWTEPPSLAAAAAAAAITRGKGGRGGTAVVVTIVKGENARLPELTLLGRREVTDVEARLAHPSLTGEAWQIVHGTAKGLSDEIEERWRWRHELRQMRSEQQLEQERRHRESAERERRLRTRLRTLTFAQLLEEPLLQDWEPSPPFPPASFRDAIVEHIRDTERELAALGPKPRRPLVRTALAALAGRIHATEAAAGEWFIETEEREGLSTVFEDLAYAAMQPALVEEIVDWLTPPEG